MAVSCHLDLALNGNAYSLGNQVIVDTLHVMGNITATINYDGRNAPPGQKSWLVQ